MKKYIALGMIVATFSIVLWIIGCQQDLTLIPSTIPATAISVKTANGNGIYEPGGTSNILVTIEPSEADQKYTLSILSGSEFASLTNNVLTAKKDGIAIIKAITTDGKLFDTCAVVIANQIPSDILIIQDTVIVSTSTNSNDILALHPASFIQAYFRNNRITGQNSNSHLVLIGSEDPGPTDNTLDGIVITGNKIVWTGTDLFDSDEGILIGYNKNATIEYNFMQNCPYGTPVKSGGLSYTSGGVAYNVYGPSYKVGTGAKGTNGVKFYNNTFYNNRDTAQGVIASIYINSNNDLTPAPASTNCEIYNNIFYTKHQIPNIYCDNASLVGLKCDYNVYYCEAGEPMFTIKGLPTPYTKWKAMGFDQHSVVINPNFTDFQSLIPSAALIYGKDLGTTWQMGLDPLTQWNGSDPILKPQGTTWQVGAYIK
jgi:hypothetical protein